MIRSSPKKKRLLLIIGLALVLLLVACAVLTWRFWPKIVTDSGQIIPALVGTTATPTPNETSLPNAASHTASPTPTIIRLTSSTCGPYKHLGSKAVWPKDLPSSDLPAFKSSGYVSVYLECQPKYAHWSLYYNGASLGQYNSYIKTLKKAGYTEVGTDHGSSSAPWYLLKNGPYNLDIRFVPPQSYIKNTVIEFNIRYTFETN